MFAFTCYTLVMYYRYVYGIFQDIYNLNLDASSQIISITIKKKFFSYRWFFEVLNACVKKSTFRYFKI
jgi:hypothetical protein